MAFLGLATKEQKAGQIIKDFIEDAKKEIFDYKKDMMREHDDI